MTGEKEKKFKPEIIFVLCSLIFGLILIILTPPIQSADEQYHFSRAYSAAHGQILSKKLGDMMGNYVPAALKEFENNFTGLYTNKKAKTSFSAINETKTIKINANDKIFAHQSSMALYSPAAYLPQSAGILITGLFTSSVYWLLIGARLFLLAFYATIGYFTIKSLPFLKWLALLLLLTPMSLSMGASVSADGVLIAVAAFYFAKILQYSYEESQLTQKRYFFLMFLAVFIALVKQSFLLTLFVFFIPKDKFRAIFESEKLKSPLLNMALLVLPAFLASLLWSKLILNVYVPIHGANPQLQTVLILKHPIIYLQSLAMTFKMYFRLIIFSAVGILGWLDIIFRPYVYWSYIGILFLNVILTPASEPKFSSTIFQKTLLIGLFLLNVFTISTIIYVTWVPPYSANIWGGLQGRYFIPVLLPFFTFLFLLCCKYFKPVKTALILQINLVLLVVTYFNAAALLFLRYF